MMPPDRDHPEYLPPPPVPPPPPDTAPVGRPPAGPRRTSPLTVAGGVVTLLAGIALAWITFPLQSDATGGAQPPWVLIAFQVLLILRGLSEALGWWFRTYDVQDDRLVIEEGILTRKLKVVPYARLQQADTYRGLIAQMFDLAQLRFATAGEAGSTNVTLRLLDRPTAEHLRAWMIERRYELTTEARPDAVPVDPADAAAPTAERVLLQIPTGRLLLGAATGSPVAILIAGLVMLGLPALVGALLGGGDHVIAILAATGFGSTFVIVGAVIATFSWVLGFYGFTLSIHGDDVQVRYGLFQVQQVTVPRRRVQRVVIDDNPLRRAFGLVSITASSAAPVSGEGSTNISVPVLPRAAAQQFVVEMMGSDSWQVPDLARRPGPARRRGIIRRCAGLLLVGIVVSPAAWIPSLAAGLLLAALGVPWGQTAHRRAGWATTGSLVALAAGVIRHRTSLVPVARIQSARSSVSPLQRYAGLATFSLDVAGSMGGARLYDMDRAVTVDLRTRLPRESRDAPSPV